MPPTAYQAPEGIDAELAAASTMRGLTAAYLLRRVAPG